MNKETAEGMFNVAVDPANIIGVEVSKAQHYCYARMGVKVNDNEYMAISYEWDPANENIPDFVMGMMQFITKKKDKASFNAVEFKEVFKRLSETDVEKK